MTESRRKKSNSQSQRERFIEAAEEAGCSDDETAFDDALRKIGKSRNADRADARQKESGKKS